MTNNFNLTSAQANEPKEIQVTKSNGVLSSTRDALYLESKVHKRQVTSSVEVIGQRSTTLKAILEVPSDHLEIGKSGSIGASSFSYCFQLTFRYFCLA